jgi:hypothetical protein
MTPNPFLTGVAVLQAKPTKQISAQKDTVRSAFMRDDL